jgi:hypothetical protein
MLCASKVARADFLSLKSRGLVRFRIHNTRRAPAFLKFCGYTLPTAPARGELSRSGQTFRVVPLNTASAEVRQT